MKTFDARDLPTYGSMFAEQRKKLSRMSEDARELMVKHRMGRKGMRSTLSAVTVTAWQRSGSAMVRFSLGTSPLR